MTNVGKGYAESICCATAGTAVSDTATAGVLNTAKGALYLPPEWWETNQGLHVFARGIVSTPSSGTATLTMGVSADTTQGTLGALLWTNGTAITPVSSAASWLWELEMDIIGQSDSGLNIATLGMGELTLPASATQGQAPYIVGSTTAVNLVAGTGYFLEIYAKWGTAVSGDTITGEMVNWIVS
jgi:hypothetical protein